MNQSAAQQHNWLGGSSVEFAPIVDVPFVAVDLAQVANPVPAIVRGTEFEATKRFFAEGPSSTRSLLTSTAQALLYTVIRNLRPNNVVEIGTYKGGTSETLCRALQANGLGTLHTVSPYDVERFGAHFNYWPKELKKHVRYHSVDSMLFFSTLDREKIRPDLVLIDGNHDYEFVNFDLQASASRLTRGGFVFVDNVSQAGPFFATTEFMARHPMWIDCGITPRTQTTTKAFEDRSTIPYTDFFVLRSPMFYMVGKRPETFGLVSWSSRDVRGLRLSLGEPRKPGTLHVQIILRAFSETRIEEIMRPAGQAIDDRSTELDIIFDKPMSVEGKFDEYWVEAWLVWEGNTPLPLKSAPVPI